MENESGKAPSAPAHLREETRAWWKEMVEKYAMGGHHLKLLLAACESWDLYCQAKAVLDSQGLTYTDRFRQPCARPEVAIMRDAKLAFVRILRELNLPGDTPDSGQLSFDRDDFEIGTRGE
jgi:P27 family predicted phage terminase small subunit